MVKASAEPNPIPPPVQALPIEASPPAPPVQTSPVVPPSVQTSPVPPSVQTKHVYFGPAAAPEDANPIVRPEPGYLSPNPPRVTESAPPPRVTESAPPPRVAESAPVSPVAPSVAESAPVSPAVPSIEPAFSGAFVPPVAPSVAVVEWPKKELEQPIAAPKPSVEPARASDSVTTGALDVPVVEEPKREPSEAADSFETAPTELAASETPIAQPEPINADSAKAEVGPTSEVAAHEVVAAVTASEETSSPSNSESIVVESEIQEHAAVTAQAFPAPRKFASSGSEMPVVITTPPPPAARDTAAPSAKLFDLGRDLLPKAEAWSRKNLRATPRTLVIGAPLIALLGIWAVRGLVSHPKHAAVAEGSSNVVAEVAAATPAPEPATANPAPATSAILISTSSPTPAAPPAAEPAELATAVSQGLPALEALAQKFPSDPQVGIALAGQQAQAQRFDAAVDSVERVIAADPKSAQNGKVMGILWRAAQSGATEPSFAALRKLGAKGADIAFDLAITAGVRDSVRERAKTELKSISADASADTRTATALLLASDCGARKALLSRAEHEGGKRTRALLEQYSRGAACTSETDKSCNSCLTGSSELTHALTQLKSGDSK